MKKLVLLLIVFGFAGQGWGQEMKREEKKCIEDISKYHMITDVKIIDDTIKVKGFINKSKSKDSSTKECKIIAYDYVFANITFDYFKFSLITVPVKIRPKTKLSQANVDS